MTPEGRIKNAVRKALDQFKGAYKFWPVPSGYGPSSLDCILCIEGHFIAIECKAPGKKPTARQKFTIGQIERAGGRVFVIDSTDTKELENYIRSIHVPRADKRQAQAGDTPA